MGSSDQGTAQAVLTSLLQDSFLLLRRRIFLLVVSPPHTGIVGVSPSRGGNAATGTDTVFLPQWLKYYNE